MATARLIDRPTVLRGLALGILLGLAYLSRQEAVYLGLTYLLFAARPLACARQASALGRNAMLLLVAPLIGGLLVVGPWLARNIATFGTLFPGQALENTYLSRNEEIFAYAERPTLSSFLAQGPATIVGHVWDALVHGAVNVIALPSMPVGVIGVIAFVALRRSPAFREPTALRALLVGGLLVYLASTVLVPVATLWGTFLHASGPILVGLTVASMLGLDAGVAWLGRRRSWSRANTWLGPLVALAVAIPFGALQVSLISQQARQQEARIASLAAALAAFPEVIAFVPAGSRAPPAPEQRAAIISDHPVWLAEALRRPVIALPDEPLDGVIRLSQDFGTSLLVVLDERGRYPGLLLGAAGLACLSAPPERLEVPGGGAWLFRLAPGCGSP